MLKRGDQIGFYEVLEPLGAGGMGEVFRARDTRLGRDVALKVLAVPFKLDADRRARFEREAHVLASLNHPNIATLHGIEDLGDAQALVLEVVDGATLAERIADGPLPPGEARAIALQIAAALDAAHEHGVVHRDLKPENVKVRADGNVKLLDFGIAKILAPGERIPSAAATATAIDAGAIMGTPAYMSPEQARGLPVDKRTDIWAFGCLLYEMLAGKRPFSGDSVSDVIARIIEREPDLEQLPAGTPAALVRLLRRCLEKDPRRRLRDIGDARLELADSDLRPVAVEHTAPASTGAGAAFAGAILALAATVSIGLWFVLDADTGAGLATTEPVTRFVLVNQRWSESGGGDAFRTAISPDGTRIAYIASRGIFVRERDRLTATLAMPTTSPGTGSPFFSPDGRWIGFTDGQMLRKVPIEGGGAEPIVEGGAAATAHWVGDEIYFASIRGVFRVDANGGPEQSLPLELEPFEQALYPHLLADGRTLLVTIVPTRSNTPLALASAPGARVDAFDVVTGARRTLIRGGGHASYVPTGHLLYAAGDSLYAVAFDAQRLELRGNPLPVVSPVAGSEFAVSNEGTLEYVSGSVRDPESALVWVDRSGREELLDAPPRSYVYPRLSPDGTRVALDLRDSSGRDIWIWHLVRKTLERFTVDPAGNTLVTWSLDGQRLVFGSDRYGVSNLFEQAADGSGEPQRLLESDRMQQPMSFAPDGRLIFSADVPGHGRDVHALAMDGSAKVEPIIASAATDLWAEVSPDGRFIAYDSDESGQFEVYVRPYPDTSRGGRWQVSSGGGRTPLWSRDGRELFYRDYAGAMLAAPVVLTPDFSAGPAIKLFENARYLGAGRQGAGRTHDLSADGSRFLMVTELPERSNTELPLVVVLNWFAELERLVPSPTTR
jgi:eukaryotic-like serine/threonine-protein kinase